ncbi:Uncharacterized membrane protein [Methanolobus vulcani]|uniref:Uncharacterized membrane protein n=1 Tax=Methanolobus vulcani TaxID=38026 RepID=A0A7Z7AXJ5_9EURY|nr:DUF2206 domain-containing protein [Methanolobus vulcani]SDF23731.1 Uncharacterized membrane protein [Methanolobus vulcani]
MNNTKSNTVLFFLVFTLITNISIILNIPIFRPILGFLYFTTIPGCLILYILKLNETTASKFFMYSVGLSISFLFLSGLAINSLYPVIACPLSVNNSLLVIDVFMLVLFLLSWIRNKKNYAFHLRSNSLNFKFNSKNNSISPAIFPIIFPFLAIFGSYLMNTEGNNCLLFILLVLIPIYSLCIIYFGGRVPNSTYLIAIWMIGLSLLFMHSLSSYYIKGSDIHKEYYIFKLTLNKLYWNLQTTNSNELNSLLSVTILPVLYQQFTGINEQYIYKIIYPLIFSFVPIGLYILFQKYMNNQYSFIAVLFFISQGTFIFEMFEHARQEIAFLFFILSVVVLFDIDISVFNKKVLFIVFSASVILSHYSTAYVFYIFLLGSWILLYIFKYFDKKCDVKPNISFNLIILFFVFIFLWYSLITREPFNDLTRFFYKSYLELANAFLMESRDATALRAVGIGMSTQIPYKLFFWVRTITLLFISLGSVSLFKNYKNTTFEIEYLAMSAVGLVLMFSMIILPFVSSGYGITRLYLQTLIFLAPCFVIGGEIFFQNIFKIGSITRHKIKKEHAIIFVAIVLVMQNICATTFIFNIFGVPYSEDLNINGPSRDSVYIYEQEVYGASWLALYNPTNITINSDFPGYQRVLLGYTSKNKYDVPMNENFFEYNVSQKNEYIYLRWSNVINNIVYPSSLYRVHTEVVNISQYDAILSGTSNIYNNGGTLVKIQF